MRSIFAGKIKETDCDKEVKLAGWVANIRDHGGIIFLDLRDETGEVQVVSNDDEMFSHVTKESAVLIKGKVRKRREDDFNEKLATGTIEVLADSLEVVGAAKNVLPFDIQSSKNVSEEIRLKYRYLDLRNPKVLHTVKFRTEVNNFLREKMNSLGHLEVQTPILTASSPEGARDFIVPARKFKGKFYALPQAPQIFKQLLMISGIDKYFQIAPCFRDEDARGDRLYGEFYQLDLERAFATEEDILQLGEEIFYDTYTKFSDKVVSPRPFKRIPYQEALEKYGTDKPDLRNPLVIINVSEVFKNTTFKPFKDTSVQAIVVEGIADKSSSWFNELVDYANSIGMPGIGYFKVEEDGFKGPIDKFLSDEERELLIKKGNLKTGDVIFFIADRKKALKNASLIRDELGRKLDLIDNNKFEFCIITDFPMYELNEETNKFEFCHNPFSMPKDMKAPIEEMVAYQYDFVCNGIEMASGAVRNHSLDIMKEVFKLAGYEEEEIQKRFSSLYEAFQYGAPPHAGMAIGIDRMLMMLLDEPSVRETVAFPMSASGQDGLMGAPTEITEMQLREAHIKIR